MQKEIAQEAASQNITEGLQADELVPPSVMALCQKVRQQQHPALNPSLMSELSVQ